VAGIGRARAEIGRAGGRIGCAADWIGRAGLHGQPARLHDSLFGLGGSLLSLTGGQRFVSRLTALLAAADSERCPVPPEGTAHTLTGRGVWGGRYHAAPPAAQAGSWPPRTKRATRRTGAHRPSYGCEPGVQRLRDPARPNQSLQQTGAPGPRLALGRLHGRAGC
jgi:hypothetical protein